MISLVAGLAPPLLHESIAPILYGQRLFNVTVTNVPGPQFPLYALGSRLRTMMPLVPLAVDHAIGLAIVSYNGQLTFGINADHSATPDLGIARARHPGRIRGLDEARAEVGRTPRRAIIPIDVLRDVVDGAVQHSRLRKRRRGRPAEVPRFGKADPECDGAVDR